MFHSALSKRRWLFSLTSKVILCSGEELTALPLPMLCCVTSNSFLPPPAPLPLEADAAKGVKRKRDPEDEDDDDDDEDDD